MKVGKGLFVLGLGMASAAGAAYFFDSRKGKERRRSMQKQLGRAAHVARRVAQDGSRRARTIACSFVKDQASGSSPWPRFAGALGGVLTVYGAGRRGPAGIILRILSLALFSWALANSNGQANPASHRVGN